MSSLIALTREVAPSLGRCELTHLPRVPIDVETARTQHAQYERVLTNLGCRVERLPAAPDLADSVFIEDAAVVFDSIAVISYPGAKSRRAETSEVMRALGRFRPTVSIEPPGTLDGGDVLVVGKSVFVGCSTRTNRAAVEQLRLLLASMEYRVEAVAVRGCLHLKSAVTAIGEDLLLVNPRWAPIDVLRRFEMIRVDPREPSGANALRVGGVVVYPQGLPRTRELLERRDLDVRTVGVSELAKAEGAVTCCSLIFDARDVHAAQ